MKAISVSLCLAQLENAARRGADRSAATLGSNANFYGVGYTGPEVQSQASSNALDILGSAQSLQEGDGELDGICKIWQHARDELANGCCAFEEVATSLVVGRVTGAL